MLFSPIQFPKLLMETLSTVLSIINAFSSVAGTIGNLLVCFVIYRNEELQTGVNFFILNLSVADLSVCTIAQPLYIYYLNQEWNPQHFKYFKLVSYIALHASFLNLLSLTINRLFAVWLSFEYGTVMRGRNIAKMVCAGWVLSIVMAIVFSSTPLEKPAPYFHLSFLLMFLLMYLKIFTIARKQRRQIVSQFEAISHNYRVRKISHDHLTTRTLAILISVSVFLFLPDTVIQLKGASDYTRFRWSFTTMFLSSFLNPCVYVWRSEKFRLALYKTLYKTFGVCRGRSERSFLTNKNLKNWREECVRGTVDNTIRIINLEPLEEKAIFQKTTENSRFQ